MITIKKILCPVDFFPASDMAVDYAATLAARYGAKMYLLHTVSLGIPAAYEYALNTPKLVESIEEAALSDMKRLAAKLSLKGVEIEIEIQAGDVYNTIQRSIALGKPDLVVMGTHGRRAMSWLRESVTEAIMRHTPVPLLTISPYVDVRASRRILVATDLSDGTVEAVQYACSLAQENDSQLTILYVAPDMSKDLANEDRVFWIQCIRQQLEDLVPPDARIGCRVSTIVEEGLPYRLIPQTLDAMKPDLLVMNIHGKSLLERALYGRAAERVVRVARCPVMLIPRMETKRTTGLPAKTKAA
jgi:universal stress protein A